MKKAPTNNKSTQASRRDAGGRPANDSPIVHGNSLHNGAKRSALNRTHGAEWPLTLTRKVRHGWELRKRENSDFFPPNANPLTLISPLAINRATQT